MHKICPNIPLIDAQARGLSSNDDLLDGVVRQSGQKVIIVGHLTDWVLQSRLLSA